MEGNGRYQQNATSPGGGDAFSLPPWLEEMKMGQDFVDAAQKETTQQEADGRRNQPL